MAAVLGNEQGENVGLAPTINRSVQSATDWSFPPERPNSGQITAKTKETLASYRGDIWAVAVAGS